MRKNDFIQKLNEIPSEPGCYIFYNDIKNIIYVGKAINLQKRVNTYFNKKNNNFKTIQLINEIYDIKYILTKNEKEALLLEYNLIKKHHPRYNILLNDDKKYPYIVITKEKDPEIKLVRNKLGNKYQYAFGPFPDGTKAYQILKILRRLYPLRACNLKNNVNKKPCLNYQIHQCLGACFKEVDQNLYKKNISNIKLFFSGKSKNVRKQLENKMLNYASNLQFEEADKIKSIILNLDFSVSKQFINIKRSGHIDYVKGVIENNYLIIIIYFYRNNELLSKDYKIFECYEYDIESIIQTYLVQLYEKTMSPDILISDIELKNLKEIFKLKTIIAKNSEDKNILFEMNNDGITFFTLNLQNKNNILGKELSLLKELQQISKLPNIPFIFEVYDISNINDIAQTAGVIVYKNGLPSNKDFRHYNLSGNSTSDYARMKELVNLRFFGNKKIDKYLNLIIVDGGNIQINAVRKSLPKKYDFISIIGLVKNKKHKTDHIVLENKQKIYIENETLFNYLSVIQDKVHNFSINQHKKLLKKNLFN